jgi:hypothetical protein
MNIFVDESGTFQPVAEERSHLISNLTALIVPETLSTGVFRAFRRATRPWRQGSGEIKGRDLNEVQTSEILKVLCTFDVLAISVCVDMGLHAASDIDGHRNGQADKYLAALTAGASTFMREHITQQAARVRALPNQLYAQAIALIELFEHVIRLGTLYYVQRIPKTLGAFRWRLDAKNRLPTEYEKLWNEIVYPHLQTIFLDDPFGQMKGADYSAFARFERTEEAPPDYLRRHRSDLPSPFYYIDMNGLLGDLKFVDSKRLTGLQIADVVASVVRRACNGNLQRAGWQGVGKLMPRGETGKHSIRFASFRQVKLPTVPYFSFVAECDRDSKPMIILSDEDRAALRNRRPVL